MRNKADKLVIENAKIIFRNFSGKETKFNRAGNRNFCVIIEDSTKAKQLEEIGWNVKTLKPRDEDDEPRYYISVTVNYNKDHKMTICMITRKKKTFLDEDTVGTLDYADISNVDLTINPSYWSVGGKSGIKAYLYSMWVTIEEDAFADKYAEEEFPNDEIPLF